jgi:hypothetical protein
LGRIRAIALDAEVFDAKQLALETGLLKRVEQFGGSDIAVLLPDVIAAEVEAHLRQSPTDAQGKLKRAMRLPRGGQRHGTPPAGFRQMSNDTKLTGKSRSNA